MKFILNRALRLKVKLIEPISDARLQVEDCWATPRASADDEDAFLIVDQFCPTDLGRDIDIILNNNGDAKGKVHSEKVIFSLNFKIEFSKKT